MITITITDPHLEPAHALKALGDYFLALANGSLVLPVVKDEKPKTVTPPIPCHTPMFTDAEIKESHSLEPEVEKPLNAAEIFAGNKLEDLEPMAAAAPTNTVHLDIEKLPWDHRIHSREKTKNKDGRWKLRRGVDPYLVTQVEIELRKLMAIPAPAVVPAPIAPPAPLPVPSFVPAAPQTPMPMMPPVAEIPAVPPYPYPVPNVAPEDVVAPWAPPVAPPVLPDAPPPAPEEKEPKGSAFVRLTDKVQQLMASKKIDREKLNSILGKYGISSLMLINSREDLIPPIMQELLLAENA